MESKPFHAVIVSVITMLVPGCISDQITFVTRLITGYCYSTGQT